MMRVLSKTLFIFASISTLSIFQISASCARCEKIEKERAQEQAEHPQSWQYYEEQSKSEPLSKNTDTASLIASYIAQEIFQTQPQLLSSESNSYSTLYTIFKTKLFLETLDGAFTLLLPTNVALRQIPTATLIELTKPEGQEKLAALISNHLISKKILKKDFETYKKQEIKAISGRNLTINSENGKLTIDGAEIVRIEPAGYDGVIYIINKVLIP